MFSMSRTFDPSWESTCRSESPNTSLAAAWDKRIEAFHLGIVFWPPSCSLAESFPVEILFGQRCPEMPKDAQFPTEVNKHFASCHCRCIFQHPNFSYFACLVTESQACLQKLEICGQGTIAILPAVYCSPCYGG